MLYHLDSPLGWRTHSPAGRKAGHWWSIVESLFGELLSIWRRLLCSNFTFLLWRELIIINGLMEGYRSRTFALAGTSLKGHSNSRTPHQMGWGDSCNWITFHLFRLLGLTGHQCYSWVCALWNLCMEISESGSQGTQCPPQPHILRTGTSDHLSKLLQGTSSKPSPHPRHMMRGSATLPN